METTKCQNIFEDEILASKGMLAKKVRSTTMRYNEHYDTDENRKDEKVFLEKQEIKNNRWWDLQKKKKRKNYFGFYKKLKYTNLPVIVSESAIKNIKLVGVI